MNNLPVISILGCGWFGLPLADHLINEGFSVKGSTTSEAKVNLLLQHGIDPYLVQFNPFLNSPNPESFFKTAILVVNIPPKGQPVNFLLQITEIIKAAETYAVKNILFISSTSVYGDVNSSVNEHTPTHPETASGKAISEAEKLFSANSSFITTIIRFAGLVGPGRHPGRFFSGKKEIPNGQAPVNLVHLDDCTGIVSAVIEQQAFGKVYHVCSPDHMPKEDFYRLAAVKAGLPPPGFIHEKRQWKSVESIQISPVLNYQFKVPDWSAWLG